jgi:hypothetical protein
MEPKPASQAGFGAISAGWQGILKVPEKKPPVLLVLEPVLGAPEASTKWLWRKAESRLSGAWVNPEPRSGESGTTGKRFRNRETVVDSFGGRP